MKKNIKISIFLFMSMITMIVFTYTFIINAYKLINQYIDFYEQDTNNVVFLGTIDKIEDINESNLSTVYKNIYNNIKKENNIEVKLSYLDIGLENFESNTIGLYYNGDFDYNYKIMKGRFFNEEDINSKEKLVVVGKDILSKCIEENGENYLLREGEKIKVIGVVGDNKEKGIFDDYIFYNLDAFINDIREIYYGEWKIDSKYYNTEELYALIRNCQENIQLEGYVYEDESKFEFCINNLFYGNKDIFISYIFLLITIVLGVIQSLLFWINKMKLEIGVRKTYGATNKDIFKIIITRFYEITLLALIVSVIVLYLLSRIESLNIFYFEFNTIPIILEILVIVILGSIPLKLTKGIIKKDTVVQMIKEGSN